MPQQILIDPQVHRYILSHILNAVESSTSVERPFPHFSVEDFFPGDVFSQLIEWLPAPEYYESFGYDGSRSNDDGSSRGRFRMDNMSLARLSSGPREFWHTIRSVFGSAELKETVFRKLASGISRRFGCSVAESSGIPGFPLPELFRETAGYRIKPHPDTNAKVVTMQVSLARDRSQKDMGTEFYRMSLSPAAWFREPKGFEIIKTMPFLPNAAYAFAVLNTVSMRSWHGRSTLPEAAGVRNSLLNFWYVKPDRANKDLLSVPSVPCVVKETG